MNQLSFNRIKPLWDLYHFNVLHSPSFSFYRREYFKDEFTRIAMEFCEYYNIDCMESGERAKEVLSNHLPFLDDNCNLEIDDILERLSKLDGMVASKTNTIPRFKRDFYALKQTIINNTLDNKWTKAVTIFKEKRAANEEYYFFIFITSKGGNYPFRLPVKKCPSLRRLYIHLETIDYERENIVKAKDGITMNELYNAYNALWLHWHWFINNVNNLHKN